MFSLLEGDTMRLVCYDVNYFFLLQHFAFNEIQILSWSTYIRGEEMGQMNNHIVHFGAVDRINTVALL